MRILLTGGTGLIGRALCTLWQEQGHELYVLSREPHKVAALCSGARGIGQLSELTEEQSPEAIINLAGAPIADKPWSKARRQVLWNSRVALTEALVDWIATLKQPPSVLVSGSAVGWYGDCGERRIDEDSPAGQEDFGSQLCFAWEAAALRAKKFGVRVALLRTAPVLARDGGFLKRLKLPFSLGLGGRLGDGRQWMPWIHLNDIVALIDFLMNSTNSEGPYNACSPYPVRNAEFTRILADNLHRPAILPVPAWLLKAMLGEMSILLLGSQHVLPSRALEEGYLFEFKDLNTALINIFSAQQRDEPRS